jgi:hypothetical protein
VQGGHDQDWHMRGSRILSHAPVYRQVQHTAAR